MKEDFKLLVRFLIGHEGSIRELAQRRSSLYYGAFFVLIAGFCREYNQEFFLEKWYLFFFPFVASAGMASLIYFAYIIPKKKAKTSPNLGNFRTFLSLFWLTAPLAWFYAFPGEWLFGSYMGTVINLWLLLLVSIWRVWLFCRCIKLLTQVNILAGILLLGCIALFFIGPTMIVSIMSGNMLSPEEQLLQGVGFWLMTLSFYLSLPLLLFYIWSQANRSKKGLVNPVLAKAEKLTKFRWNLVVIPLVGALAFAIPAQIKEARYCQFRDLFALENYKGAFAYLSQFEENDLPARTLLQRKSFGHFILLQPHLKALPHVEKTQRDWIVKNFYTSMKFALNSRWSSGEIDHQSYLKYAVESERFRQFILANQEAFGDLWQGLEDKSEIVQDLQKLEIKHEFPEPKEMLLQ